MSTPMKNSEENRCRTSHIAAGIQHDALQGYSSSTKSICWRNSAPRSPFPCRSITVAAGGAKISLKDKIKALRQNATRP